MVGYFRSPFPGFFRSQSTGPEAVKLILTCRSKNVLIVPIVCGIILPAVRTSLSYRGPEPKAVGTGTSPEPLGCPRHPPPHAYGW